jgi:hypothetical protein
MEQYNLTPLIHNNYMHVEIRKGMYGLATVVLNTPTKKTPTIYLQVYKLVTTSSV